MSDFKKISDFKKTKRSRFPYQDPTYLSFLIMFDFADPVNSPFLSKTAEEYLAKLADGNEFYKERLEALINFKIALKAINIEMPWYWQTLDGLERIQQYDPENSYFGGDGAELSITTLESLNLPIAGLMHLYKKAVFDENKWSYILPKNLREFRMYVYVTEVRTIKNMSKPTIGGVNLRSFPDNFKPSLKIKNSNEGISGETARPYFMFGFKSCQFDLKGGTDIFTSLKKTPEASTNSIKINYEILYSIESRVLNGIVTSEFNNDNLSPAPDSESGGPKSLMDWAKQKALQEGKKYVDRAVTDLKTKGLNKKNELIQEAKDKTINRAKAAANNIYKDFVQGVEDAVSINKQEVNITTAIADNVHGGLINPGSSIGDTLNSAARDALGNIYNE